MGCGFARVVVLAVTLAGCSPSPYVLPTPDGGSEASPPALDGRIVSVRGDELSVATDETTSPRVVEFRVGSRTQLFTVYGGFVSTNELSVGQRVRVWFEQPGIDPRSAVAAAIVLASMDPNDDWP